MKRRTLLSGAAALVTAGLAAPRLAWSAVEPAFTPLVAAPGKAALLPAPAKPTDVWGYGGSSPGPEIRVKAGERVRMRLENNLPQSTAVHWHGIRIDNAMDGAAGLTQDPVEPGQTFDYDFVVPDPGTYWYHSHDRSWEQNARGLNGPLIVEEAQPWEGADREIVMLVDDWTLKADGQIETASFGDIREWSHGGRIGNTFTVNGVQNPDIPVRANERIRLRFINAANARIMGLHLPDHAMTVIALDGHAIAPRPVENGVLLLAPAQRADVVVDFTGAPGARVALQSFLGMDEWVPVAGFTYDPAEALPARGVEILPLPDTMKHSLDLDGALKAELTMDGGAMGSMMSAKLQGRVASFEELVSAKRVWAFNGVAGDLDEPLFRVERGRTVHLTMNNKSRWPHATHLHGHHFQVLSRNGQPDPHRDWRDTVLNDPSKTLEVAFDATNPGKWLLHCHMLEHQAGGMITWFEVT